ncbi:MAG: carbon starvation CstA family protein [Pseudomonadota bacterium]
MLKTITWAVVALLGALALGVVALNRGEPINAVWIVIAAACVYLIAYRFYAQFISTRVLQLDPSRPTPAITRADGLDFVATDRRVLFGHHFAAIAGAGPLVGPVLAAQMGYLPGMLWILAGVVLAGAVQDFMILFISMRREGRSLGELVRLEMGTIPGTITLFGAFLIMVIILAVLALIVVKALAQSPWGMFTVAATIPLAFGMGAYSRWVRPGKIGEVSLLGLAGLILAIVYGRDVAESAALAPWFTFSAVQLCWILIGYGAVASLLPVWLLLAPRDYLSTFLKIGAILALAVGILVVAPPMRMPAITAFAMSGGPVWSGPLFPFLFITIACGAVSGFHALIASGTTPKLIANESHAPFIGYGAMLAESMVAIMALVGASVIDPGVYFTMNSPAAVVGTSADSAAQAVTAMGFAVTPDTIEATAKNVGETTIISRAGGAPTLAVGMAQIFSQVIGGKAMMAFWYHFAILFEALFILTAVDAGTRACRFMLQDLIGLAMPSFRNSSSFLHSLVGTFLCVAAWGFFLYQGVTDPLGGVNTLWPLFGISNQMLAAIALILATVVLFRMKRERYAWVTVLPTAWLLVCTLWAGLLKLISADPKIGFLAHAAKYNAAIVRNEVLSPAKSMTDMRAILLNDRIDAALTLLFMLVLLSILIFGVRACLAARAADRPTAHELPANGAVA